MNPLVSIVIVTRNRTRELIDAVESCYAQTWRPLEVMVIDDQSSVDIKSHLLALYPEVRCLRSPVQMGPSPHRGRAFRACRGEFLFSLDDDAYFSDPRTIEHAVELFQANSRTAVVAVPVIEPFRSRKHLAAVGAGHVGEARPRALLRGLWKVGTSPGGSWMGSRRRVPGLEVQLATFMGGASAFRRRAALAVDGVRPCYEYFGGDENDLAIRLLDKGFQIVGANTGPIVHQVSVHRDESLHSRYDAQSALLFDYLNIPFPQVVGTLAWHAVRLFLYRLRPGVLIARMYYVLAGLGACIANARQRQSVSRKTYRLYRALPKHTAGLWTSEEVPGVARLEIPVT